MLPLLVLICKTNCFSDRCFIGRTVSYFTLQDGYIYNALVEEHQWRRLWKSWDTLTGLITNYLKMLQLGQNIGCFKPLLIEWTMQYTVEEIYRGCQEKGIPIGPVRTADQVLADRQMIERGFFVDVEHQVTGRPEIPGGAIQIFLRFSGNHHRPPLS